jgi:hypothetical protein
MRYRRCQAAQLMQQVRRRPALILQGNPTVRALTI